MPNMYQIVRLSLRLEDEGGGSCGKWTATKREREPAAAFESAQPGNPVRHGSSARRPRHRIFEVGR